MAIDPNEPSNPLLAFTQGEPESFTFLGSTFKTKEECEQAVGQYLRSQDTEKAELKGQVAAAQHVPQKQQVVSGKEPEGYDHQKALEMFTQDGRKFIDYTLKAELFGDPNMKGSAIELIRNYMVESMQTSQKLQEIELKANHPEVNWSDQALVAAIGKVRAEMDLAPNLKGVESAIAIMQTRGQIPLRQQWAQQQAAQNGEQPQGYQPQMASVVPIGPPAVHRSGAAPSFDEEAFLMKMSDPSTPLEEKRKMHAALMRVQDQQQRRA